MTQQDEIKQLFIEADARGDRATAEQMLQLLEQIQVSTEQTQQNTAQADVLTRAADFVTSGDALTYQIGTGEAAISMVTGTAAQMLSGLAGLADAAIRGGNAGADTVKYVQELLTYKPQTTAGKERLQQVGKYLEPVANIMQGLQQTSGDIGYDLGGPVAGALFSTLPDAFLEMLPGSQIPRVAKKVATGAAERAFAESTAITDQVFGKISKPIEDIAKKVNAGDIKEVAFDVNPDPRFFKAMDELDIRTDPAVFQYSGNTQVRDIMGNIAAKTGSTLGAQGAAFTDAVSKTAQDLIQKWGGRVERGLVSDRYVDAVNRTINDLKASENDMYTEVANAIDRSTVISNPKNIREYLDGIATEFGGVDRMPSEMKGLYKRLFGTEKEPLSPTYKAIDYERRQIYEGARKQNAFSTLADRERGELYAAFRKDIDEATEVIADEDILALHKEANTITAQRKTLEDQAVDTMGKRLEKGIVNVLATKIQGAGDAGTAALKATIDNILPDMRGEVIASALGKLMDTRQTKITPSGERLSFAPVAISRNLKALRNQPDLTEILFKDLPAGAKREFEALVDLSDRVVIGNSNVIKNGRSQSVFDENVGMLAKMFGPAKDLAARKIYGRSSDAAGLIERLIVRKEPRDVAAGELLSSTQFQNLVADAVSEGVVEGSLKSKKLAKAEKLMQESKQYKQWANMLSDSELAQLSSAGLVNYLLEEQIPEQTEQMGE